MKYVVTVIDPETNTLIQRMEFPVTKRHHSVHRVREEALRVAGRLEHENPDCNVWVKRIVAEPKQLLLAVDPATLPLQVAVKMAHAGSMGVF